MRRYLDQKLKLRQLRAVSAIALQGSLQKAAQSLGITQPALTKSLREVEDLLGVRMFERHVRGVEPNAFGTVFVDGARRILDVLRDVEEAFDRIDKGARGTVVVGALPTAAAGLMPEVVQRMRTSNPDIAIRVIEDRTDELLASLMLGDIDLIVGRLYPPTETENGLTRATLYDEPMAVIVGSQHALTHAPVVTADDIMGYELSLPIATLRIHADTSAYLESLGISASDGIATTSLALLRELLLSTYLVTVMPGMLLAGDLIRGQLRALRMTALTPPPPRPAGLIYRADRPLLPSAQRVAALVAECAADIVVRTMR